jgi:DNA polymerase-4
VVGDNEKYAHTCNELSIIYSKYTPDIEIYSIDEAFLDITTTQHLFGGPEARFRSLVTALLRFTIMPQISSIR